MADAVPHVHKFDLHRTVESHGVVDGEVSAVAPSFVAVLAPYRVGDVGDDGPMEVTALANGWIVGDGSTDWQVRLEDGAIVVDRQGAEVFRDPAS